MLNAGYHYLDLVPKGRDETKLSFPQEWVRHHDSYQPAIVGARLKPPSG
jgi:predicted dithiol-disulfide oxidoreductase (DUF899 family)